MVKLNLRQMTSKPGLLSRGAADAIVDSIAQQRDADLAEVVADLTDIVAVAPSFLDQLLTRLEELSNSRNQRLQTIRLLAVPTRLSEKFAAIGRGHDLGLRELRSGDWVFEKSRTQSG